MKRFCIAVALAMSMNFAMAQGPGEDQFKSMTALGDYKVQYKDQDGKAMDYAAFSKQAFSGNGFEMSKDTDTKVAVVQLKGPSRQSAASGAEALQKLLGSMASLSIPIGSGMPDLSGEGLDGKPVTRKAASGKYSLLSFYFSECAPCIAEVPDLNRFARKHPEIDVVGVTFDSAKDAQAFKSKHGLEVDSVASATDYINRVGIKVYPTLVIVDSAGKLVASKSGGIRSADESDGLKSLEAWFKEATHGS